MSGDKFASKKDPVKPKESCGYIIGKLPLSAPRSVGESLCRALVHKSNVLFTVGTTPGYYNYLKGSRPLDPGMITDNGTLVFGHQVRVALPLSP